MTIALLILMGLILISDIRDSVNNEPSNLVISGAVNALLWWNVSLPVAIVVICISVLFVFIALARK